MQSLRNCKLQQQRHPFIYKVYSYQEYKAKSKRVFTQNYKYILHFYKKKRILLLLTRRSPGAQVAGQMRGKVVVVQKIVVFFVLYGRTSLECEVKWEEPSRCMRQSFKLFQESAVSGTLNSVTILL